MMYCQKLRSYGSIVPILAAMANYSVIWFMKHWMLVMRTAMNSWHSRCLTNARRAGMCNRGLRGLFIRQQSWTSCLTVGTATSLLDQSSTVPLQTHYLS